MDGKVQVSFITVAAAALTGGHKQTAAAVAAARQKQTASGGILAWKCCWVERSKIANRLQCAENRLFTARQGGSVAKKSTRMLCERAYGTTLREKG